MVVLVSRRSFTISRIRQIEPGMSQRGEHIRKRLEPGMIRLPNKNLIDLTVSEERSRDQAEAVRESIFRKRSLSSAMLDSVMLIVRIKSGTWPWEAIQESPSLSCSASCAPTRIEGIPFFETILSRFSDLNFYYL
jgi:hypothetical protein